MPNDAPPSGQPNPAAPAAPVPAAAVAAVAAPAAPAVATPAAPAVATPAAPAAQGDPAAPKIDDANLVLPEKYELKMPEGVALDPEINTEFQAVAKDLKLNAEQAQKLGDLGAKIMQKQTAAVATAQAEWAEKTKTDKEFGGENLDANLAISKKALQFASPEMVTLLRDSKLGDHPEVIRWMYRVGKAMGDDNLVLGSAPGEARDNSDAARAARLYPTMKPKT